MIDFFTECFTDHLFLSLIWIFLFVGVIYTTVSGLCSNFSEISCHEAIRLINKEGSLVVDVRNSDDFYRGHIINSIHLSVSNIRSSHASELFKFQAKPLIIVCDNGVTSCTIARYLCKLGFKRVYVLKGGIVNWNNESFPLVVK